MAISNRCRRPRCLLWSSGRDGETRRLPQGGRYAARIWSCAVCHCFCSNILLCRKRCCVACVRFGWPCFEEGGLWHCHSNSRFFLPYEVYVQYVFWFPQIVGAGVVNGHVGLKYIYVRIFRHTDKMHRRDWVSLGSWIGIGLGCWIIAWIISEAIPTFNDLLSLIVRCPRVFFRCNILMISIELPFCFLVQL